MNRLHSLAATAAITVPFFSSDMAAAEPGLESYFPPQLREIEVRRSPLEPKKRDYLKGLGMSEQALDLYGDVYVSGYNSDHLRWGDLRPLAQGDQQVTYDTSALRQFDPLPADGVHPRMLFTDADRPAHRTRLETTTGGKEALKILMSYTELLKGSYDKAADYAQPDTWQGSHGNRGFLPLMRAGGDINQNRLIWQSHIDGIVPTEGRYHKLNFGLSALEAFRCWLYEDADGANQLARAVETALRNELNSLTPGSRLPSRVSSYNLMFIYDFIYNWLSAEQRELIHGVLIAANYDNNQYGVFQDALGTTSNWSTFSYRLFSWLGLEGDPGYNDIQYAGYLRGMQNYLTYGWFKAGPCFEAFGKNQLGGEIIYAMALRGSPLAGHPNLLATMRNYLPHAILPWGGEYIAYDRLGGVRKLNQNDILPLKHLLPDDKHVDWIYRNTVLEDYSWKEGDLIRVEGYHNNALFAVLWTVDYDEENDDPGKLMAEESFLGPQRGLVITRSDWSRDALYLHHHVRGATGGHVFADRSSIILAGQGRMWIPNPNIGYKTRENNVVDVDGINLVAAAPARLADYKRTPLATFSTADLRPTWNYRYDRLSGEGKCTPAEPEKIPMRDGWERDNSSINDYALENVDSEQYTLPLYEMPHWLQPGAIKSSIRKRNELQFKKAFRNAGMVRPSPGTKGAPYALVMDDYETADGEAHTYDWLARLAPDLSIVSVRKLTMRDGKPTTRIKDGDRVTYDVLMAAHSDLQLDRHKRMSVSPKKPALLVRILQMESDPASQQPSAGPVSMNFVGNGKQLAIRTVARNPKFKILLFPHLHGSGPLPETNWDAQGEVLTVKIADQIDTITFTERADGPTGFELKRANEATGSAVFSYMGNEYQQERE